ncbi:MAG: S8 family serine peptidase, partial [Myxococcota bacterium]
MKTEQVQAKQYVVMFPNAETAQANWPQGVAQDRSEAAFSTETRKVATLSQEMVDSLVKAGAKVVENYAVSIPPGEMESRLQMRSDIEAQLKESVFVHGADKLHAVGIKGNSSAHAPTMVTIDTGIAAHKDLQTDKRGLKFYDVFDKSEEAWNDKQTHGTHCSGIMMAHGGVTGMAPDAKFIGIKVLDDEGSGTLASVMSGIDKAIEYFKAGYKPMVCNMSLGAGPTEVATDALVAKVKEAADLGIYFAIAAGNSGPRPNSIGTPGTTIHPNVIPVAAFETRSTIPQDDDSITSFSSRGGDKANLGQDSLRTTGMGADGSNVLSTINEDGYAKYSGTSMAAP